MIRPPLSKPICVHLILQFRWLYDDDREFSLVNLYGDELPELYEMVGEDAPQYLEYRNGGISTCFEYCPFCGTKIKWELLKNQLAGIMRETKR